MRKISRIFAFVLVLAFLIPNFATAATVAPAEEGIVERLAGGNRYTTSVEISEKAHDKADTVILAAGYDGDNFVDALAGTPLAHALGAPILLTEKDEVSKDVLDQIKKLEAKKVILLGGELAISKAVEEQLTDYEVERISGGNRYSTAVAIGEALREEVKSTTAIVVYGYGFADGLSVGPAAALEGYPVVLTDKNELPETTLEALEAWGITDVIVIGGDLVISEAVRTELGKEFDVEEIFGATRQETALEIAEKMYDDVTQVLLVTGYNFADALAGGPLAAINNAPILLTGEKDLGEAGDFLSNSLVKVYVLGGPLAISEDVVDEVVEIVEAEIEVTSVRVINDIVVDYGTLYDAIDLPETVTAELNNGEEVTLDVAWPEEHEDYDATEAGDYTFEYELLVPVDEEFTLPEDLAEGTITVTVKTLLVTATEAVEKAEGSLLDADIKAAEPLVTALKEVDLVEAAKLQVRLNNLEPQILAIVKVVNDADTQFELEEALQQDAFVGYNRANISGYQTAINEFEGDFTTIDQIQNIIHEVNNQAKADAVVTLIAELPEEITLKDKAAVEEARAAYEALTDVQKDLVTNKESLVSAETEIDKLEGQAFIDLEIALPAMATIEAMDAEELAEVTKAIEAAKETYENLSDNAKEHEEVAKHRGLLTNRENKVAETYALIEATPFIEAEKALPAMATIEKMDVDELAEVTEAIEAAKETYEALSDDAKEHVEVIKHRRLLTNRENAVEDRLEVLADLEEELAEATEAVVAAEAMPVTTPGNRLDKQNAINEARTLVEALDGRVDEEVIAELVERLDAAQKDIDLEIAQGLVKSFETDEQFVGFYRGDDEAPNFDHVQGEDFGISSIEITEGGEYVINLTGTVKIFEDPLNEAGKTVFGHGGEVALLVLKYNVPAEFANDGVSENGYVWTTPIQSAEDFDSSANKFNSVRGQGTGSFNLSSNVIGLRDHNQLKFAVNWNGTAEYEGQGYVEYILDISDVTFE